MPDYSKAKVYTIRCRTDNTLIYVGSTISSLSKRWGQHKSNCYNIDRRHYDFYIYRTIRNNGGFENWYIELYEDYSCNSKDELHRKEGEITRLIGTLNSLIAGRNVKEYYEEHKEEIKQKSKIYHEENRDKILEKGKIYREENKEKNKIYYEEHKEEIKQKSKIYYEENKDEISKKSKLYREENKEEKKEYLKEYYQEHKEEISEQRKIKYTCDCGSTLQVCEKARHERSIKHTNYNLNSIL